MWVNEEAGCGVTCVRKVWVKWARVWPAISGRDGLGRDAGCGLMRTRGVS